MDIMHYRGIYILVQDFNTVFGTLVVPSLKLGFVFVAILSFVTVLRLSENLNVLLIAMLSMFSIASCVLLTIMSLVMSKLFDTSVLFKRNFYPTLEQISDKQLRIYYGGQFNACQLIRGQVGGLYHMEARAKLSRIQHLIVV